MNSETTEWLTEELKGEVRKVFQPRYQRELSDEEVMTIAENLSELVEEYAKFRWRKEYERK